MPSYSGSERARTLSQEAAYWYVVCTQDAWNMHDSDKRNFVAWMRRSVEHVREFYQIATLDGKLRMLNLGMRSPMIQHSIRSARIDNLTAEEEEDRGGKTSSTVSLLCNFSPPAVETAPPRLIACTLQGMMMKFTDGVSRWLVVRSAGIVVNDSARYKEQWLGDLADLRSPLKKLTFAINVLQVGILLRFRRQRLSAGLNAPGFVQICRQDKMQTRPTMLGSAASQHASTVTPVSEWKGLSSEHERGACRGHRGVLKIAVTTAVILCVGYLAFSARSIEPSRVETLQVRPDSAASADMITTSAASLPTMKRLSDGTAVTLEASTALRIAFTGVRRDVRLLQGRATFEVAEDPKRPRQPFVVNTHVGRVAAVRTKFVVTVNTAVMEVEVYDGEVDLRGPDPSGVSVKLRSGEPAVRLVARGLGAMAANGTNGDEVGVPRG